MNVSQAIFRSSRQLSLLIIFFSLLLLHGCVAGRNSTPSRGSTKYEAETVKGKIYVGTASYYGEEFAGRPTANGEIFNPFGLTAAHPFLALGTKIKVTNLKNKKSVTLRVNDRMPYHPDRIIDLSKGAAKALDMLRDGLVQVKIEVLETDTD